MAWECAVSSKEETYGLHVTLLLSFLNQVQLQSEQHVYALKPVMCFQSFHTL